MALGQIQPGRSFDSFQGLSVGHRRRPRTGRPVGAPAPLQTSVDALDEAMLQ
ncbi:hypothetical protein ACFRAO_24250 [Streptomyces sp. NPDC056656]|uniref:hypothetical protein n=1 Tax=Streptomyces sp. NPDC056656 TaxID=3345895 RepID=UPI0036BF2202